MSQYFETIRLRKDGSKVPVSITLSPIKNEDGKVVALSANHKDLTERHRTEEALRRSEERIRTVMEGAADGIITIDESGIVESFNPAAEELFGYKAGEIIGQNINMLTSETDRAKHDGYIDQYIKTGQSKIIGIGSREITGRRKDGSTLSLDLAVSGTFIGDRRLFIGILRDITERKRAEEELKLARNEAETASSAKSEFLSTMSHELRSPLNAVIGFSDLLLRDADESDEMIHRLVPKIRDSGKYLLSMIEEMLDLDRIAAGKVRLDLEPNSLNDLVFRVTDSWNPRVPEGFSLSLQLDHASGIVGCDSTRISQILNNLIDNAIKYSPGGGKILVRTIATADEVQVSVQDEGMGISPEEKEIIFDRFRQLESGYTRRAGGLGIGLALAHELMEAHGGRIWVESEKGEGSTFTIALPRIQVTDREDSRWSGGAGKISDHDEPWAERTILIVDDVDHYHEYIKILMRNAARVVSAYNGEEALEVTARERPDIILMDLRMPVMDGFEAINLLKSDPQTKGIPVLAVTAQAMNEDRERSMREGADGFVTKPIDTETLKDEMRRLLGAKV